MAAQTSLLEKALFAQVTTQTSLLSIENQPQPPKHWEQTTADCHHTTNKWKPQRKSSRNRGRRQSYRPNYNHRNNRRGQNFRRNYRGRWKKGDRPNSMARSPDVTMGVQDAQIATDAVIMQEQAAEGLVHPRRGFHSQNHARILQTTPDDTSRLRRCRPQP